MAQQTSGFDFVMLLVDDMTRARTFYESLFDLKTGDFNSEYFVEYELPDGNAFALGMDPSSARTPSGGIVFGVDDAQASIERVKELGGKFLKQYGGERCVAGWCEDTEGNTFGVHQRKATA